MLMLKRSKQQGFTIVELLIVIVVIAILATISVIAYRGIQYRAYIAKAASAVDSYVKILELYKTDHGTYPYTAAVNTCLGTSANYPASGNYSSGDCGYLYINSGPPMGVIVQNFSIDSTLNSLLAPYASTLPDGSLPDFVELDHPGFKFSFRGIQYNRDPSTGKITIRYETKGSQSCSRGETTNLMYVVDSGFGYAGFAETEPGGPVDAVACELVLEPGT